MEIKNAALLKQLKSDGLNYTNDIFLMYFVNVKVKEHFIDIVFAEIHEGECKGIIIYEVAIYETRGFIFRDLDKVHIDNWQDLLDQWLDYNPNERNELLFSTYFYTKSEAEKFAENDLNGKKVLKTVLDNQE